MTYQNFRGGMHWYIMDVLEHPIFSFRTQRLMQLLVSGIRNDVWLDDTMVYGTPEKGCKIETWGRTPGAANGYYDLYVHDNYSEIYVNGCIGPGSSTYQVSNQADDDDWDQGFNWEKINEMIEKAKGKRSS